MAVEHGAATALAALTSGVYQPAGSERLAIVRGAGFGLLVCALSFGVWRSWRSMGCMLVMRPAVADDRRGVAAMIGARCDWMEREGLPSWRPTVDDLVSQCENPCGDVWVLEMDGARIVGRTTVQDQGPPWGWTDSERSAPALYLNTTVTDPAVRQLKLGALIAWWAVDRAARLGVSWVRRDCLWPQLADYYQRQGFTLVREAERGKHRFYMLARRAEALDLSAAFTGTPSLRGAGR